MAEARILCLALGLMTIPATHIARYAKFCMEVDNNLTYKVCVKYIIIC